MVNESYELIKFLEFIKYKVRKIYIPIYSDNINNPVDLREHPYAGDILRIFNEDNDTDDIDINIDKLNEFNKYKNLGMNLLNITLIISVMQLKNILIQ